MTITIELPPAIQAQAQARADQEGLTLETWMRHIAELALIEPIAETYRQHSKTFGSEGLPGIETNPAIMDGEARIIRTRIPVWLLVGLRQQGMNDNDLLEDYPSLSPVDLEQAWEYARLHADEITQALRDHEEAE